MNPVYTIIFPCRYSEFACILKNLPAKVSGYIRVTVIAMEILQLIKSKFKTCFY